MDLFGRIVWKQRKIIEERDTLISRIQGLPGFQRALSFILSVLQLVWTSQFPQWCSDILVLLRESPPYTHFGQLLWLCEQMKGSTYGKSAVLI